MTQNKEIEVVTPTDILKALSSDDFLGLGMEQIAYIRPIVVRRQDAFAIHAADGTPLSIAESQESALILVRRNDLEPVTVH